ncbi:MAG: HEAT repeat domain-containing protein, partial [Candidatus Omnitrophica bacterium]|nr:HEAT repeat domain-containing protein [Candidatus Omnitrophota bacterium]
EAAEQAAPEAFDAISKLAGAGFFDQEGLQKLESFIRMLEGKESADDRNLFLNLFRSQNQPLREAALITLSLFLSVNPNLRSFLLPYKNEIGEALTDHLGFPKAVQAKEADTPFTELITLGAKIGAGTGEKKIAPPDSDPSRLAQWIHQHRNGDKIQELQVSIGFDTSMLPSEEHRGKFIALFLFIAGTYLKDFQALVSNPKRDSGAAHSLLIRGDEVVVKLPGQAKGRRLDYIFNLSSEMTEKSLSEYLRQIQLFNLGLLLAAAEESYQLFFPDLTPPWMDPRTRALAEEYRRFERELVKLLRAYDRYLDPSLIRLISGEPEDHRQRQEVFRKYRLEEALYPASRWLEELYSQTNFLWQRLLPVLLGIEGMMLNLRATDEVVVSPKTGEAERRSIGSKFIREVRALGYQTMEKMEALLSEGPLPKIPVKIQRDPFIDPQNEEATRSYLQKMADQMAQGGLSPAELPDPETFFKALAYYQITPQRSELRSGRLPPTLFGENRSEVRPTSDKLSALAPQPALGFAERIKTWYQIWRTQRFNKKLEEVEVLLKSIRSLSHFPYKTWKDIERQILDSNLEYVDLASALLRKLSDKHLTDEQKGRKQKLTDRVKNIERGILDRIGEIDVATISPHALDLNTHDMRAEVRNVNDRKILESVQEGLKNLISILPEGSALTWETLRKSLVGYDVNDQFKEKYGFVTTLELKADLFVEHLGRQKPRDKPWRILYFNSDSFEGLLTIYGDPDQPQAIVSVGSIDFYPIERQRRTLQRANEGYFEAGATQESGFEKIRRLFLGENPKLAQVADDSQNGPGFVDGAHFTILQKDPKASKEDIIKMAAVSLARQKHLRRRFIAAPGALIGDQEMDLWTAATLNEETELRDQEKTSGLEALLPPAIGVSTKYKKGGFARAQKRHLNVYGISPAAILIALKRNPVIHQRYFNGEEPERLRIAIRGVGGSGSTLGNVLANDYPVETGLVVSGISDVDTGVYSIQENDLPRQLLRERSAQVDRQSTASLKGISEDYRDQKVREISLKEDPNLWYQNADVMVLATTPATFTEEDVQRLFDAEGKSKIKIVVEINPDIATSEAITLMTQKGILFIPYTFANIGVPYAIRQELLQALLVEPIYTSQSHIVDGIAEYALAAFWHLFSDKGSLQNFPKKIDDLNRHFANESDILTTALYELTRELQTVRGDKEVNKSVLAIVQRINVEKYDDAERTFYINLVYEIQKGMKQRLPYIVALRKAIFEELYGEVLSVRGIDQFKKDLNKTSKEHRMSRRVAAYSLGQIGRTRHLESEKKEIIHLLGDRLLNDRYYRVRANAAKALGHIGDPVAIPYLIQALTNPDEADPKVREWILWALYQLKKHIDWDKILEPFDEKLAQAQQRADQLKKDYPNYKLRSPTGAQEIFSDLGKAYYQLASISNARSQKRRVLKQYRNALTNYKEGQQEGGMLPFSLQLLIAETYLEVGKVSDARKALL